MGFFRENILKFIIIFAVVILITIGFSFIITRTTGGNAKDYSSMEEKLKEEAKSYAERNEDFLPKTEGTLKKISLDTLVNEKKLKQFYALEDSELACTGYVTITKNDDKYKYQPYIKCGNYYETTAISDYIMKNEEIVSDGAGLYKYNDTYIYRGENPNNYIALSNRIYRIIEITSNNELKVISTELTEDETSWDDRYNGEKEDTVGINDFSKSRLKDSLNELYKSEYFTAADREKIIKHDLCVGKRALSDGSIDGKAECSVLEKDQYVGILQVNEYARASIDVKCTSALKPECQNYNYIDTIFKYSIPIRTQTAVLDNTYKVYYINVGELETANASQEFRILPIVYLDKDTIYSKGDGTIENPYIIK